MKKIYSIVMLSFFLNVSTIYADEFFMRCGKAKYKYVQDSGGDKVFYKHPKGTKNKYIEWCKDVPNIAMGQVSVEGRKSIIKEKRAICITPKTIYIKDGIKTERTNGISVSDFTNLTRHVEFYHIKTGNKKNVRDFKCKKK